MVVSSGSSRRESGNRPRPPRAWMATHSGSASRWATRSASGEHRRHDRGQVQEAGDPNAKGHGRRGAHAEVGSMVRESVTRRKVPSRKVPSRKMPGRRPPRSGFLHARTHVPWKGLRFAGGPGGDRWDKCNPPIGRGQRTPPKFPKDRESPVMTPPGSGRAPCPRRRAGPSRRSRPRSPRRMPRAASPRGFPPGPGPAG